MKNWGEVLNQVLLSVQKRDGKKKVCELEKNLREVVQASTKREILIQIIAQEKIVVRIKLLLLYPEIIVPYLVRIKGNKTSA